jgi:hypothetical protein
MAAPAIGTRPMSSRRKLIAGNTNSSNVVRTYIDDPNTWTLGEPTAGQLPKPT